MCIVNRDNCPGSQVIGRPLCYCTCQYKSFFLLGKSQRVLWWFCPRHKLDWSVSMKYRLGFFTENIVCLYPKFLYSEADAPSFWWSFLTDEWLVECWFVFPETYSATDLPASLLHVLLYWFPLVHDHYYLGFLHSSCIIWSAWSILCFFFTNLSLKHSHELLRAQELGDSDFCNSSPL